jgi:hypothetical protein
MPEIPIVVLRDTKRVVLERDHQQAARHAFR